jgi:lipoprotein-anchoring transpeptidase ErfK/SrfK
MTSSNEYARRRSSCAFWFVLGVSLVIVTMIAGATLAMTPGRQAGTVRTPNTPLPPSWAQVNIAKPTYTPSPVPTATATVFPTIAVEPPTTEPTNEPVAAAPQDISQVSQGGKYILVSISDQHLEAYDNGQLVYSFVASTGMRNSTRVGQFSVLDKIPNAYGATWNIWMPDWLGIYYSGSLENGIHALPILPDGNQLWAGYLGTPISFGCVVLGADEAQQLYNWVDVGTPVEIRW